MPPRRLVEIRHEDGRITVAEWYREVWFSDEFLQDSDPTIVHYDPDTKRVEITVANGQATYQVFEDNRPVGFVKTLLTKAEIDII